MSWYVYQLLSNRQQIRANLYQQKGKVDSDGDIIVDTESEDFDDLLALEIKIEELNNRGLLSEQEEKLLIWIQSGQTISQISIDENMDRETISKKIRKLCDRLGFLLGGKFTDSGYLNYLKNKHRLTDEELVTAKLYIEGKFKTYRGKSENTK